MTGRPAGAQFVGLLRADATDEEIQQFLDRVDEIDRAGSIRIDAHQHFWKYGPDTHGWIDDSMAVLKRDFLPKDLAPLLHAADFDGCVAVQAQTNITATEWLLSLADQHEFIRGVVGWVDLCSSAAPADLERLSQHPRLVGIRHVVQSEPDGFMSREDFRRGIAALAQFDLTYDILIFERQLTEALDLVRAFPDQRFVIDHIAKPDIKNGSFDAWRAGIEAIAREPNASCKLSGMVTEADWSSWTPAAFEPYLDVVVHAFGPTRCMLGSDWPVCILAGDYATVTKIVIDYANRLSASERDAILGGTASAFYRL
jgi:L-fuconolactonase